MPAQCLLLGVRLGILTADAPVAQLDRVSGFEPGGREFESLRARHKNQRVMTALPISKFSQVTNKSPHV